MWWRTNSSNSRFNFTFKCIHSGHIERYMRCLETIAPRLMEDTDESKQFSQQPQNNSRSHPWCTDSLHVITGVFFPTFHNHITLTTRNTDSFLRCVSVYVPLLFKSLHWLLIMVIWSSWAFSKLKTDGHHMFPFLQCIIFHQGVPWPPVFSWQKSLHLLLLRYYLLLFSSFEY